MGKGTSVRGSGEGAMSGAQKQKRPDQIIGPVLAVKSISSRWPVSPALGRLEVNHHPGFHVVALNGIFVQFGLDITIA